MKELTKKEIEQVNGGIAWLLVGVAVRAYASYIGRGAAVGAAAGALGGAVSGALER
jgi:lactobin A/cerein 7B family class IIb bacteriocin